MEYCELILCTISNSINFTRHSFNRQNDISLIRHSIFYFVNNLFNTQCITKNIALSVSVVAVQVFVPVIKGRGGTVVKVLRYKSEGR